MADRDIETVSEEEWQSEESDFLEEGDEGENQDESVLLPFEQSMRSEMHRRMSLFLILLT